MDKILIGTGNLFTYEDMFLLCRHLIRWIVDLGVRIDGGREAVQQGTVVHQHLDRN